MTKEGIKLLIKKFVPHFIRKTIGDMGRKNLVLNYYKNIPETDINSEELDAISYLKQHSLCVFPYSFQDKYNQKEVEVLNDETLNLKYVLLEGKRLYFIRDFSISGIRINYTNLLLEQDLDSPHRYLTDDFNLSENDILVDVGSAEGNLPLAVIDKVKKVYLFEADENWLEPLRATFAPWKDKVEIINKFVSDKNDENHVSLDEFFKDKERFNVLKIDAEGAESDILKGAEKLLSQTNPMKVLICCYHKPNDEKEFSLFFNKHKFHTACSKGYMIFNDPKTFFPPYLRRGVMRAKK